MTKCNLCQFECNHSLACKKYKPQDWNVVLKEMEKDMKDQKECLNGHKMTGIGFDDYCPECEKPWKAQIDSDWEIEFYEKFGH